MIHMVWTIYAIVSSFGVNSFTAGSNGSDELNYLTSFKLEQKIQIILGYSIGLKGLICVKRFQGDSNSSKGLKF